MYILGRILLSLFFLPGGTQATLAGAQRPLEHEGEPRVEMPRKEPPYPPQPEDSNFIYMREKQTVFCNAFLF